MSKRRQDKTTKKQIVEWAIRNLDECGMGCDANEYHRRCWRCGYVRNTERCHVIPHSLGGPDEPHNYRLLCNDCHQEAPNVDSPTAMDEWIRDTSVSTYDTFWEIRKVTKSVMDKTSIHFGHKGLNHSTREWVLKEFRKEWKKEKGYELL
jgi:5-methylcytosine-specific restriction endonuclease McrA